MFERCFHPSSIQIGGKLQNSKKKQQLYINILFWIFLFSLWSLGKNAREESKPFNCWIVNRIYYQNKLTLFVWFSNISFIDSFDWTFVFFLRVSFSKNRSILFFILSWMRFRWLSFFEVIDRDLYQLIFFVFSIYSRNIFTCFGSAVVWSYASLSVLSWLLLLLSLSFDH